MLIDTDSKTLIILKFIPSLEIIFNYLLKKKSHSLFHVFFDTEKYKTIKLKEELTDNFTMLLCLN